MTSPYGKVRVLIHQKVIDTDPQWKPALLDKGNQIVNHVNRHAGWKVNAKVDEDGPQLVDGHWQLMLGAVSAGVVAYEFGTLYVRPRRRFYQAAIDAGLEANK